MLVSNVSRSAVAAICAAVVSACNPTPPAGGGGGGGGGGGVVTDCAFAPNQTTQDLRMNCTVTGAPANRQIDPLNANSTACSFTSLTLFNQAVQANATFIYGENGDDSAARVRIGAIVAPTSTHSGSLAKSAGDNCNSTIGPVSTISTTFGGTHVALIDKGQVPHCVFQSRFEPSTFNQTLTAGLTVDPSIATREATLNAIKRTLDLESARAVNRLLGHADAMDNAFRNRAGRCQNDYAPFTGP